VIEERINIMIAASYAAMPVYLPPGFSTPGKRAKPVSAAKARARKSAKAQKLARRVTRTSR